MKQRGRWSENAEQAEGGEHGEGEDEGVEEALGQTGDDGAAEEEAGGDGGDEQGVEGEGGWGDETQLGAEGDFREVDEEEEPGGGADEGLLGEGDGEQVEAHDGAGGVGEHGGDTGDEAHGPGEGTGVGYGLAEVGVPIAQGLEQGEDEHDSADERAEPGRGQTTHPPPTRDHADECGGEGTADVGPLGVTAEEEDGADIAGDEHGEDHSGGGDPGEELGEEHDVEQADTGQAAFGDADSDGGEGGERPLAQGELGQHVGRGFRVVAVMASASVGTGVGLGVAGVSLVLGAGVG